MRRVRMPYKRFSPISDTFLVTPFGSVFRQIEFFNSHKCFPHNWDPQPAKSITALVIPEREVAWQILALTKYRPSGDGAGAVKMRFALSERRYLCPWRSE
jgi:hypothetical protein